MPAPTYAARIYTLRGVTKNGRPGAPSTRIELPLVDPPPRPAPPGAVATETSIVLTWPVSAPTGPAIAYNIYKGDGADPINAAPAAEGNCTSAPASPLERRSVLRSVQWRKLARSVWRAFRLPGCA